MFENFTTELTLWGVVEIVEIKELQEIGGNKNISVKAKTTRRRVNRDKNLVKDHDIVYLKLWAAGAEYIHENAAVGDVMLVRGEIRGKYPNIDLRVKSFEILTAGIDNDFEELIDKTTEETISQMLEKVPQS